MKASVLLSFLLLLFSCAEEKVVPDAELEQLKTVLFKPATDISSLPIYADPPTGDYEEMAQGKFMFQLDSSRVTLIRKYKKELEPMILQRIDSGYAWVYLAAYLEYQAAIPLLREKLLRTHSFYGWEQGTGEPDAEETTRRHLEDQNYCYQLAYIRAIEYISKKPVNEAVRLTASEKDSLAMQSAGCVPDSVNAEKFTGSCQARWLLGKLAAQGQ
jgi:hypothetical protein